MSDTGTVRGLFFFLSVKRIKPAKGYRINPCTRYALGMDRIEMLKVLYRNRKTIKRFLDTLSRPEKTRIKRKILHEYAVDMRGRLTPSEKRFKDILYQNGYRPIKSQMKLQFMIIDFALPKRNLLIEVDGEYHNQKWKQKHDKWRDEYLISLGFNVLRMTNEQVENKEYVLNELNRYPESDDNEKLFNFLVTRSDRRFKYLTDDGKEKVNDVISEFINIYSKEKPYSIA